MENHQGKEDIKHNSKTGASQDNRINFVRYVASTKATALLLYVLRNLYLVRWNWCAYTLLCLSDTMNHFIESHELSDRSATSVLIEDRTNHLYQQYKADLFFRTSTFCEILGNKVEKINFTLKSHLLVTWKEGTQEKMNKNKPIFVNVNDEEDIEN